MYFLFGLGGPLHKIQGYRGHQNVSKCRCHHSGDICTYRKTIESHLFIYGPKCFIIFVSPAFHCGGNARVIKRTRPVPDSCVSMEAFFSCIWRLRFSQVDLPRVYKCEMVSFQFDHKKLRTFYIYERKLRYCIEVFFRVRKRASGNASMEKVLCVSVLVKFPRAETRAFLPQWKAGLRLFEGHWGGL